MHNLGDYTFTTLGQSFVQVSILFGNNNGSKKQGRKINIKEKKEDEKGQIFHSSCQWKSRPTME